MEDPRGQAQRVVNELADRGVQASAALTEANQRVINEFMGLSMQMAQESSRLFLQLQQVTVEMLRESQAAALRYQMVWPEMLTNPLRWYQSVWQESMDGARKAFESTQQAGSKIEHALSTAASRMKDV